MSSVPPPVASASTSAHWSAATSLIRASVSDMTRMIAARRARRPLRRAPSRCRRPGRGPGPYLPARYGAARLAETVCRGITEARHLVHLGDGGAGGCARWPARPQPAWRASR